MRRAAIFFVVGFLGFSLGPIPEVHQLPQEPTVPSAEDLAGFVRAQDAREPDVRSGLHSRIEWAQAPGTRTKRAVVYLHGFSASPVEMSPVPERVAQQLGANLYLPRLRGHGISADALTGATAEEWLHDAAEALAVGRALGDELIVMGTSTGGTIALLLQPEADAFVLVSPNLEPRDHAAELLLYPWMTQLFTLVLPAHTWTPRNDEQAHGWTTTYSFHAVGEMMSLVDALRDRGTPAPTSRTLVLHTEEDDTIDVRVLDAWLHAHPDLQVEVIHPRHGESPHVLAGAVTAPSQVDDVVARVVAFLD